MRRCNLIEKISKSLGCTQACSFLTTKKVKMASSIFCTSTSKYISLTFMLCQASKQVRCTMIWLPSLRVPGHSNGSVYHFESQFPFLKKPERYIVYLGILVTQQWPIAAEAITTDRSSDMPTWEEAAVLGHVLTTRAVPARIYIHSTGYTRPVGAVCS